MRRTTADEQAGEGLLALIASITTTPKLANKLPPPIPSSARHAHLPRDCLLFCSARDAPTSANYLSRLCPHLARYMFTAEIVRMVSETTRLTSDNSFCSLAVC